MRHPLIETPGLLPGVVSDARPGSKSRSNHQYLEDHFLEESKGWAGLLNMLPLQPRPRAEEHGSFFLFFFNQTYPRSRRCQLDMERGSLGPPGFLKIHIVCEVSEM